MKLIDLKPGDIVIADGGFTCVQEGEHTVHRNPRLPSTEGLYIHCTEGEHYLDGQEDTDGNLVGLKLKENEP